MYLQQELEKATSNNNATAIHLQKLIEELKHQKTLSDEESAKFKFENTILKLENEKYTTMLNVRDREIKVIQEEMIKLQDQVNVQLNKLNANIITPEDSSNSLLREFILFLILLSFPAAAAVKETGDATTTTNRIAQIRSTINDNSGSGGNNNELPCAGDANEIEQSLERNSQEILQRIAEIKVALAEY